MWEMSLPITKTYAVVSGVLRSLIGSWRNQNRPGTNGLYFHARLNYGSISDQELQLMQTKAALCSLTNSVRVVILV